MINRPNILVVMTDQQRYDSLGCYGNEIVQTPVLDQLAQEGVRFEQCYVNATICTPSRASIMTGLPVPGHGVYKLHDILPKEQVLFPRRLQDLGYKTALVGKLHVSGRIEESERRHPHDGFDVYEWCVDPAIHLDSPQNAYAAWLQEHHPAFLERLQRELRQTRHYPESAHFSYWAAERTIAFLEKQDKEQPFFCLMSLFDPHDPYYDYPPEAVSTLDKRHIKQPSDNTKLPDEVPEAVRREQLKFRNKYSEQELIDLQTGYYASIGFLDRQIGRVLQRLRQLGMEENTLVVFLSDHGDMMGDKGLLTKGGYFYEPCVKVPFMMRMPGVLPTGQTCNGIVQAHDLAATVLHAAGCSEEQIRQWMPQAISLMPMAQHPEREGRPYAVTVYRNSGYSERGQYWDDPQLHGTMYRDEHYKLNVYHRIDGVDVRHVGELFDLLQDPMESTNLWHHKVYQAIRMDLQYRMMNWMVEQDVAYNSGRGGEALTRESKYA